MTFIKRQKCQCIVCGKLSFHKECWTVSSYGWSDLDMRPSESMRSILHTYIQTCPRCGYCAPRISKPIEKASEVIKSNIYKKQLNSSEFPKLANAFLCSSLIQENANKFGSAGWSSIYAAWVCDDEGLAGGAKTCRERAIAILQRSRANTQKFTAKSGDEEIILVDLLRRSGRFDEALKTCEEGLRKNPDKLQADILRFEKILIEKLDIACHVISEPIDS